MERWRMLGGEVGIKEWDYKAEMNQAEASVESEKVLETVPEEFVVTTIAI